MSIIFFQGLARSILIPSLRALSSGVLQDCAGTALKIEAEHAGTGTEEQHGTVREKIEQTNIYFVQAQTAKAASQNPIYSDIPKSSY